jgi:hypothetical protein
VLAVEDPVDLRLLFVKDDGRDADGEEPQLVEVLHLGFV